MFMFFLHRKQGFLIFGCISYVINVCMEEVIVDIICGKQLDGGDCTHTRLYTYVAANIFSNLNENKMSDIKTPV